MRRRTLEIELLIMMKSTILTKFTSKVLSLLVITCFSLQSLSAPGSTFPQHCHEQLRDQLRDLIKNSEQSSEFKEQLQDTLRKRMLMSYQKLFLSYVDLENRMKGMNQDQKIDFLSTQFGNGNAKTIAAISRYSRDNASILSQERSQAINRTLAIQSSLMSEDAKRAMAIQTEKYLSTIRNEGDLITDSGDFDNFFLGMKNINRASDLSETVQLDENDRFLLKMLYSNKGKHHFEKVMEQMKRHFPQRNFHENDIKTAKAKLGSQAKDFAISLSKSTDAIIKLLPKAVENIDRDCQLIYEAVYAKNPRELIKCPAFMDSIIPDEQGEVLRGLLSFVEDGQAKGMHEIYPSVHQFELTIDSCKVVENDGNHFVELSTNLSNLEGITKSVWSMSPENGSGSTKAVELINPEKQVDMKNTIRIELGQYDGDFPTQLYLIKNQYRNKAKVKLPGEEKFSSKDSFSITGCSSYPTAPPPTKPDTTVEPVIPPPIESSIDFSITIAESSSPTEELSEQEKPEPQEDDDENGEAKGEVQTKTNEELEILINTESQEPYKARLKVDGEVVLDINGPKTLHSIKLTDKEQVVSAEIFENENDNQLYTSNEYIVPALKAQGPEKEALAVGIKKVVDKSTQEVKLTAILSDKHKDAKLVWSILEPKASDKESDDGEEKEEKSDYEELGSGKEITVKRRERNSIVKVVASKEGFDDASNTENLMKCNGAVCIKAPVAQQGFMPPSGTNQAPQMNMQKPMRRIIVTPGFF